MGYRNYIGFIPKREYNKIKSFTKEQLYAYKNQNTSPELGHVGVYDLVKEVHELGKYCDFNTKGLIKPFFKNKDLHNEYNSEYEFYIIQKPFLEMVINSYKESVKTYYSEILNGIDANNKKTWTDDKFAELYKQVRSMSIEWNQLTPFNLEKGEEITTSWKYEYAIFELVRIYKSFDWKRNIMAYYGY